MEKIITFFNHKWGVWKTTLVHNLAYALADMGKSVLLVDADPQMNLTAAMYGLSTHIDYSTETSSKWMQNVQTYISLFEYLREHTQWEKCWKTRFHKQQNSWKGIIDLIAGDIRLANVDADLTSILKSRNEFTRNIPIKFIHALRTDAQGYDFVLIDTSPSASSSINALLVMSSDYFIAPVAPSFFSLQAIDNLSTIFRSWIMLLDDCQSTQAFPNGIDFRVKFLWLVIQLAKRFQGGGTSNLDWFSRATEEWADDVNASVKRFHTYAMEREKSVTTTQFENIFGDDRTPFIIEKCCHFTNQLWTIAEKEGIPVIHITQDICRKHSKTVNITKEGWQYKKSLESAIGSYKRIAKGLTRL